MSQNASLTITIAVAAALVACLAWLAVRLVGKRRRGDPPIAGEEPAEIPPAWFNKADAARSRLTQELSEPDAGN